MLPLPIKDLMTRQGLTRFGVCRYADALPLLECRAAQRLPKEPRSILMALFPYRLPEYSAERTLSKYAVVPDYHRVAVEILEAVCEGLRMLYPQEEFAAFADNSPIREVHAAHLAGLGVIGDNGLLINETYGSWVFLGEIVTSLPLEPDTPLPGGCLHCGACQRHCPGGAIRAGTVNTDRCVSHITQKKGELAPWEEALILKGGLIWGCDRCSEVCPMNRNTLPTELPGFLTDIVETPDLAQTTKELKKRAFGFRGKAVLERNTALFAAAKAGESLSNSGDV